MDPIATGCLLALWHPWLLAQRSVVAFLRSKLFYAVPLGVLAMMWLAERSFKAYMAHDTLVNLGIVVCVARFVFFPEGLAGRLLNLAPVRAVGVLSYSLYLWQELFVDRQSSATIQTFPLNLLLAFTVAIGSVFPHREADAAPACPPGGAAARGGCHARPGRQRLSAGSPTDVGEPRPAPPGG